MFLGGKKSKRDKFTTQHKLKSDSKIVKIQTKIKPGYIHMNLRDSIINLRCSPALVKWNSV